MLKLHILFPQRSNLICEVNLDRACPSNSLYRRGSLRSPCPRQPWPVQKCTAMRSLRMAGLYVGAFTSVCVCVCTLSEVFKGIQGLSSLRLRPEAKMVSLGAVFMSVSRPPDGAARPQRFHNHK